MISIIKATVLGDITRCDLCYGKLSLHFTAVRDAWHTIYVYRCIECGTEYDFKVHAYDPIDCPKHAWIFSHREFFDNPHNHSIELVFQCDRCGRERRERQDTESAGISGRVEIDDPRTLRSTILNKSLAKQMFDKETYKEFFKDATDEPKTNIIV